MDRAGGGDPNGRPADGAAGALVALLREYDRANRLAIDVVYAQFSPTLDDFYAESLRLEFPVQADALGEVGPEIVLTRTVPGQEPKSVRGAGAPFPLHRARALLEAALARSPLSVRPRQVGGSQRVALYLEPEGIDVTGLLPGGPPAGR
jgi:hypothetical protein